MATTRTEEEGGRGQEFGEKEVVDENVREFLRPSSLQQQQQQHRYMVPPLRHGWTRVLVWTMGILVRPLVSLLLLCLPIRRIACHHCAVGNPTAAVASISSSDTTPLTTTTTTTTNNTTMTTTTTTTNPHTSTNPTTP